MTQNHCQQEGTFHITTNAKEKIPWCTMPGVPEILIDNLIMTRNIHHARLYAFCILPDHVHMALSVGEKGLSRFMQSFKCQSSRDVSIFLSNNPYSSCSWDPRVPAPGKKKNVLWQNGFYDKIIQDSEQRSAALTYVHSNAWRHGLCASPEDWPWSSLRFEHLLDPTEIRLD